MAGKSPGGLTEVKKPRMISTEVLEINGLAETRPVTHYVQDSSPPSDPTTPSPGTEARTKPWPSSGISHLPLTPNPRPKIVENLDDEYRLLPGNYVEDPDAVLIGRPQTKGSPSLMAGGVVTGGPRPTNTLTSKPYEFSTTVTGMANVLKRRVGGAVGALMTKTTVGDNVKRLNGRDALADVTPERDAKRPRLGSSHRSQDSVQVCDGDDDVDMLSAEQAPVRRQRLPQTKSGTPSLLSQHSNLNVPSYAPGGRQVSEYMVVESIMDSKPGGKNGSHRQDNDHTSTSEMSASNIPSPVIDLSADDAPLKVESKWQGTARPPTSRARTSILSNHSDRGRQTGYTSDHFHKSSSSEKAFNLTEQPYVPTAESTKSRSHRESNLRDSFVQSDGIRRNSNISLSSDELQNESHDAVTRVSPQRRTAHEELQRPRVEKPAGSQNLSTGLPQSNIRSTNFSSSRRNIATQKAFENRAQQTNGNPFFGVDLVFFSYGNLNYEVTKGQAMGLAKSESDGCLDVIVEGKTITERSAGCRIQPEKLQKIIWAEPGRKVRLEFSKCGTDDSKGDLELKSEKDVAELVRYLHTSSSCKVISKPSETLDKMFIIRSSEQKARRRLSEGGLKHAVEDVALLEARKKRRDGASQASEQLDHRRSKRRPTDSRLIDQLSEKKYQNSLSHSSSNLSDDHGSEGSMHATEPVVAKHLKKDKLFEKSPTKPRVTRSAVPKLKLSSLPFEGLQPELRYSKTHSLGPRWHKPLIYPKVGKKKSTVEYEDLERLEEGEFLNDNLIGFYLRFLEYTLEQRNPDLAKKIYFFNTYFFASLTNTPRGKRGINYEAVQKWTRSVDLFQYDYVVVPINESAHWYVAIICNLPLINRHDVAANDDPSESPNIAPITDLDVSDPRSTSPLQHVSQETVKEDLFTSLEMELEKSNEQDTRESFAEMNLDDRMEQPPHGPEDTGTLRHTMNFVDKDERDWPDIAQEPANRDMVKPAAYADEDIRTVQDDKTLEQASEVQEMPLKAPVSVRRGKRKSQPPQRINHPDQPTIITFDSLGLAHAPTVRNLKDYLHEEGRTKRDGMEWEDTQIKGMTAKQIPLQDNFCDCGLFLLGYVEKFLEDPRGFITRTLRKQFDEEKDWPKMVPSKLRSRIWVLIMDLHGQQQDEKRENAIRAGKYRGHRQQVPVLPTTDTAETGRKAAVVGDAALSTALGNRIKSTSSAEPKKEDTLQSAPTVGGQDQSTGPGALLSSPAAVDEAPAYPENIHDSRTANLGSHDSTPIVLDSQSQGQSTHEQLILDPSE